MEKIKIWTAPEEAFRAVVDSNVLPILLGRSYYGHPEIKYGGTAVHMPELSPDPELWREYRWLGMGKPEFMREYLSGLQGIQRNIGQIKTMVELVGSPGFALLGPEWRTETAEVVAPWFEVNYVPEWVA